MITKELFKTYINTPNQSEYTNSIISGSYDTLIDIIIDDVYNYINDYCNTTYDTDFPDSLNRVVVEMIKYNLLSKSDSSLTSYTLGDLSESYKTETNNNEYPESILRSLNRYKKLRY